MSKLFNRAKMTTTTTGTGNLTLGSAASGFVTFATAGVVNGDVVRYCIEAENGTDFEIGEGSYTASGTVLSRADADVQLSSNSNNRITLASGTHNVFITAADSDFTQEIIVTVANAGAGNKYVIDGTSQQIITLLPSITYRLDQSDSTNATHPLVLASGSADGSTYSTGVRTVGTPGSKGSYTEVKLEQDAPALWFKCSNHAGMGNSINLAAPASGGTTDSLGTVSGSNLDLATGNFFEVTANNQTLTFSNPPAVHNFNVKITGSSITTGFDLSTVSYDSASFSFASQDSLPKGARFGDSGTRMFIVGNSSYRIYSYTLSTAYDITTASYDNKSLSILNETQGGAVAVDFNANGTKMFTTGYVTDAVHEYALSTAFDVTTASHTGSHSTSSQDTGPQSVVFHPSGTSFYYTGNSTDKVYQYSMSTAFDVSTASYANKSFLFTSQDNTPEGVSFSTDGTKMFMVGRQNNYVYEYALSTAYDVSTASYSNKSFSVAAQDNTSQEIIFNANGTKFYVLGSQNDKIYQYSCGGTATKIVTFPSTVSFESGSAPTPPANAAIKTVALYTVNSGTNYYDL